MHEEKMLSHKEGNREKELVEHLKNVQKFSEEVFGKKDRLLRVIALSHDFGKIHPRFQEALRIGNKPPVSHSPVSAAFAYFLADQYGLDVKEKLIALFAVYGHHAGLKNFGDFKEAIREIVKWKKGVDPSLGDLIFESLTGKSSLVTDFFKFCNEESLHNIPRENSFEIEDYFYFRRLFSSLVFADRIDAAFLRPDMLFIKKKLSYKRILNYIKKSYDIKRGVNKIRWKILQDLLSKKLPARGILSLKLPTGAGKTLISLTLALKAKEKYDNLDRVIYVIPFINIITQTAEKIKKIFYKEKEPVLEHHHLAEIPEKEGKNLDIALLSFDGFFGEIVVTTYVSFLNAIFGGKTTDIFRFSSLKNSIIVLDEVQAIPFKYFELSKKWMEHLAKENLLIAMSATLPKEILPDKTINLTPMPYSDVLLEKFKRNKYKRFNQIKDIDEFVKRLIEISQKRKKVIIIFNSIERTQHAFLKFLEAENCKSKLNENFWVIKDGKVIACLTTYMCPLVRKKVLNKIKEAPSFILFSTQTIEAGVNLDSDVLLREFAPPDSIFQAGGRCNREKKREFGEVFIFELEDSQKIAEGLYGRSRIKEAKQVMKEKEITDVELNEIVEEYFKRAKTHFAGYIHKFKKCLSEKRIKEACEGIKLIEKGPKRIVIIDSQGRVRNIVKSLKKLSEEELRNTTMKIVRKRRLWGELSKYAVQLWEEDFKQLKRKHKEVVGGTTFHIVSYDGVRVFKSLGVLKHQIEGVSSWRFE